MIEHNAAELGFMFRPLSTRAVCVDGRRLYSSVPSLLPQAEWAVLKKDDERVLVRCVEREPDGWFSGEIHAFEPSGAERIESLSVGDRLRFRELHVFTYTAPPGILGTAAVASTRKRRAPASSAEEPVGGERSFAARFGLVAACAAALVALPVGYVIGKTPAGRSFVASVSLGVEAPPRLRIDYELRRR